MRAGKSFNMTEDAEILKINSPKNIISGPYIVIYKNLDNRWALCALDWEDKPKLGIRCFWGNAGWPVSRCQSTWFVLPPELTTAILNGLPIDAKLRSKIDDFLSGKIDGENLKRKSAY